MVLGTGFPLFMTSCAKATQQIAQDAFDEFISEVVEDLEVCFFTPAGKKRVFREANKHVLISTKLWVEVDQFKTAFDDGGGVYEHFVLVAPGLTGSLSPLFSLLHRIRRVGSLNRPWTYRQLTSSFRTGSDFYTTVSNGKSWQETGAPDLAGKVNYMRPKRTSEPS